VAALNLLQVALVRRSAPAIALAEVQQFKWLSGEHLLQEFVGANGTIRTFCKQCGSSLGFRTAGAAPEQIEIAIACFDDDIPVVIDAHIYTDSKACWFEPDKELPQFPQNRQ